MFDLPFSSMLRRGICHKGVTHIDCDTASSSGNPSALRDLDRGPPGPSGAGRPERNPAGGRGGRGGMVWRSCLAGM